MFAHRGSLMLESIKENIEAIGGACVMLLCSPRTCLISTIDGEKNMWCWNMNLEF